jgi:membrane-bound lytic murein transglycosylase B
MDQEKEEMESVVTMQRLQKEESSQVKQQQQYYLEMTEQEYQAYLREKAETEKKVAEIRARIFDLVGVSEAPTFGEALEIAEYVEGLTGVRPAFLLAVMKQESNIGRNVGQCYLKNPNTGAGIVSYNGKSVDRVMKPTRDVQPFLTITKELGRDPYNTLVSCPMSFGYGGAMGPAQFIPSTWMVYRERLKAMTGRFADPWNIKDAFLAAGLYLSDYGAANQTYNSEWKAAMIYFSGSTNSRYSFYGNNVLAITKDLQEDIDTIKSLE